MQILSLIKSYLFKRSKILKPNKLLIEEFDLMLNFYDKSTAKFTYSINVCNDIYSLGLDPHNVYEYISL